MCNWADGWFTRGQAAGVEEALLSQAQHEAEEVLLQAARPRVEKQTYENPYMTRFVIFTMVSAGRNP